MINKNTPIDWKCESLKYKIEIIHGFGFKSEFFKSFGTYSLTTPGNFYEEGGFKKLDDKQKFYDGPVSFLLYTKNRRYDHSNDRTI